MYVVCRTAAVEMSIANTTNPKLNVGFVNTEQLYIGTTMTQDKLKRFGTNVHIVGYLAS